MHTDTYTQTSTILAPRHARPWIPKRVVFTPQALDEAYGQQIYERIVRMDLPVEVMKSNRITGLRGETFRQTYQTAKSTLAVVTAPPSQLKLQPIPPSADYQFHLAQGCPAHCQYCYLAGSLSGPPVIRTYANLSQILDNLMQYEKPSRLTTFEASCYTDPLGIEHLTGSLSETIKYFGTREGAHLRWVSKYSQVENLLPLDHNQHTRCRISMNAEPVVRRLEGGTSNLAARLRALRKLALPRTKCGGGYPVGVVLAPIMPIPNWQIHYERYFEALAATIDFPCNLTFECITHRFTPSSKDVLMQWYPNTSLEMDETSRVAKTNKFGGHKYVYAKAIMQSLNGFITEQIETRFPQANILYWT